MRRRPAITVATLVLATLALPVAGRAAAPTGPVAAAASPRVGPSATELDELHRIASRRVIVGFKDRVPSSTEVHAAAGGRLVRALPRTRTAVVVADDPAATVAAYRARDDVEFAERDGVVKAFAAPPDEAYYEQWNLQPASAANRGTANWEPAYPTHQGEGVRVAVLDTGFRSGGRDAPERLEEGATTISYPGEAVTGCSQPNPVWNDDVDHGTHVTGTIAQRTANPKSVPPGFEGVAGIAPRAIIVPIKVLDCSGGGLVSNTVEGIELAVNRGAKVINLSLGGPPHFALCRAVTAASPSAIIVAATGNEGTEVAYPAACPNAMAVGSVRYDGGRPGYSNASCETSIVGPGGDLTRNDFRPANGPSDPRADDGILQETFDRNSGSFGYFWKDGTSMAAAHVAGAAAVLFGARPDATPASVSRALKATARDLQSPGADDQSGYGALDIATAVDRFVNGSVPPVPDRGYWLVASDGGLFAFGGCFLGSAGGVKLNRPVIGATATPDGAGYWMVAGDGGIFSFGTAAFYGSTGAIRLNRPIVGMASSPTGRGYWLVASDGGIFSFGDAGFFGSTGAINLAQPIVGMASTPSGRGYWLVAADGGIFAFGDARFHGSTGAIRLNRPIVGMATTRSGNGYWLVATDGGIFAFGDARFHGSTGAIKLNQPIVAMGATPTGNGYWLTAADGGIFGFGDARFRGSTGAIRLTAPIVAFAVAADRST